MGVLSMTGFGGAQGEVELGERRYACDVEVRTVNHRHLKISARTPEGLNGLIPQLEAAVRSRLKRGSVYLTLRLEQIRGPGGVEVDLDLVRELHAQLAALALHLGAPAPRVDAIAALPGVVSINEHAPEADALWPEVEPLVAGALDALVAMRRTEGELIARDLRAISKSMLSETDALEAEAPAAVAAEAERLRARVQELCAEDLSPADLAREVALLADRADVNEELARLRGHLEQVESSLSSDEPVGRKLDFLAQELLREANTMGNKCRDGALVHRALELKLSVERLKEQVANVE